MSEAKESENKPTETQGSPIELVAAKRFPSGAQLTKVRIDGQVCYIRENAVAGSKIQSEQILEICAPEWIWERASQVVALEDSLKRRISKNMDFTEEGAEKELSDAPQGYRTGTGGRDAGGKTGSPPLQKVPEAGSSGPWEPADSEGRGT